MRITQYLIALILIGFFLQLFTAGAFTKMFEFNPYKAVSEPWRFITPIFVHGGFIHLFFNLFALFLFGPLVERAVSKRDYLIIFFVGGFVASLLYFATILIGITPPIPAVGASGAIYAILGAAAVLFPRMVIYIWFFPMEMRHAVIFWIITQTLGTFDISSGVASAAHLGGLLFGLAYTKYMLKEREGEWEYY